MITAILDACRDQLCDCATFRTLVGAATPAAAQASVVRLNAIGAPRSTAHAVLDIPRVTWRPGSGLIAGSSTVEGSIVFPIPSGQTVDQAIAWASETFYGQLCLDLMAWSDDRLMILEGIEVDPPLLLDAADDLPSWFLLDLSWSWRLTHVRCDHQGRRQHLERREQGAFVG